MKTIFKLLLLSCFVFVYVACKKDRSIGLPSNLLSGKPDSVLISKANTLLPDSASVIESLPSLFSDTSEQKVIITKETEVYVTFLYEGATWENSFGYYTYMLGDSPSIANKQIVFPNISGTGGGGGLKAGDMVKLGVGKFPVNTVIGFYLVAKGWEDGEMVTGIYTHYTNKKFNINKEQQSILFIEKSTGKLILGFEDMASSGGDYNDVVVSVSDSMDPLKTPVSFDLSKVPKL